MNLTAEQRRDAAVLNALVRLEEEYGCKPGEGFVTRRVAIAVESGLRPLTADCSLYRLERSGYILRHGKPGYGTIIHILRRPGED